MNNPGDQTMYLIFGMAQLGLQGGIGLLKLTGTGTAYVASLLASLGRSAGKVLFRRARERSLVKHGDIETTVFTFAAKDKAELTRLMKRNHINGYIAESKSIFRKRDGDEIVNLFIRTTDSNRLIAVAGHLVKEAARIERATEIPENAQTIDMRHETPVRAEAEEFSIQEVEAGEPIVGDAVPEREEPVRDGVDEPHTANPEEASEMEFEENEVLSMMEAGTMANEVTTDPFQEEETRLGEEVSPDLPDAQQDTLASSQEMNRGIDDPDGQPPGLASQTLKKESTTPSQLSRDDAPDIESFRLFSPDELRDMLNNDPKDRSQATSYEYGVYRDPRPDLSSVGDLGQEYNEATLRRLDLERAGYIEPRDGQPASPDEVVRVWASKWSQSEEAAWDKFLGDIEKSSQIQSVPEQSMAVDTPLHSLNTKDSTVAVERPVVKASEFFKTQYRGVLMHWGSSLAYEGTRTAPDDLVLISSTPPGPGNAPWERLAIGKEYVTVPRAVLEKTGYLEPKDGLPAAPDDVVLVAGNTFREPDRASWNKFLSEVEKEGEVQRFAMRPVMVAETPLRSPNAKETAVADGRPPVHEGVASMLQYAKGLRDKGGKTPEVPVVTKGKER